MSNKMVRISVPPDLLEELKKRQQALVPFVSISSIVRHYITLGLPVIRDRQYMYSTKGGESILLSMPEELIEKCSLIQERTGIKSASRVYFTAIVEGIMQADAIAKKEGVL